MFEFCRDRFRADTAAWFAITPFPVTVVRKVTVDFPPNAMFPMFQVTGGTLLLLVPPEEER